MSSSMPWPMLNWIDSSELPTDSYRILLTVEVNGIRYVSVGGYDHSWSGKCWVIETPQLKGGTVVAWANMPEPAKIQS